MKVIINAADWTASSLWTRLGWHFLAWRHGAKIVRSGVSRPGQVYVVNVTQIHTEPISLTYTEPELMDPKIRLIGETMLHDSGFKGSITDLSNT